MGQAKGNRASRRRTRSPLPVVAISSAYDMAAMLARHGGILREYAWHYLGGDEATEDELEAVVGAAVDWLLAQESPSHEHGMRYATQALYREAQRELHRRELRRAPVDRRLGPLTGARLRVLDRLGPRSRETILRIAQGESAEEIARSQNTTLGTVRIRLFRARERALKLLEENGGLQAVLFGRVPHRVRARAARLPTASPNPSAGGLAISALVPVVACSLLWPFAPAPAPGRSAPPVALQEARGAVLSATAPAAAPSPAPSTTAGTAATPGAGAPSGPALAAVPVARTAREETPEDMLLTAATPAPDYEQTHTVVALGVGRGCQCWALLQSTDGAATWQSEPGPVAGGNQVVLPPTYPSDPRIFIGTDASGSAAPSWTASFTNGSYSTLATPPGQVAVPAGLDSGDGRVFVAATGARGGVWAQDLATGAAAPVLTYPRSPLNAAALATPWGEPSRGVLVWAPAVSSAVGGVGVGSLTGTSLFACPPQSACSPTAALDLATVGTLVSSPSYNRDHVLVATYGTQAERSVDGGQSFSPMPLPAAVGSVLSVASSSDSSWVFASLSTGARGVWRTGAAGGWQPVSASGSMQTHDGELVPLSVTRMLVVLNQAGYRCSTDGGLTWAPRCPVDP